MTSSLSRRKAKILRSARREFPHDRSFLGLPSWVPVALGIAALGGAIYAVLRSDSLRIRLNPLLHDVGEFFGLTEEHGIDTKNITHDRTYRSTIRS